MNLRALEKRVDELEEQINPNRIFVVGGDLPECQAQATDKDVGRVVMIATGVHRAPSFNEGQ